MVFNLDTTVRVKLLTPKGKIKAVKYITYAEYKKRKKKNSNSIKIYPLR